MSTKIAPTKHVFENPAQSDNEEICAKRFLRFASQRTVHLVLVLWALVWAPSGVRAVRVAGAVVPSPSFHSEVEQRFRKFIVSTLSTP